MGHDEFGGGGTLFQMNNMLCEIMKSYEVGLAIVAFCRCRRREVEGGLRNAPRFVPLSVTSIVLWANLHVPSCRTHPPKSSQCSVLAAIIHLNRLQKG